LQDDIHGVLAQLKLPQVGTKQDQVASIMAKLAALDRAALAQSANASSSAPSNDGSSGSLPSAADYTAGADIANTGSSGHFEQRTAGTARAEAECARTSWLEPHGSVPGRSWCGPGLLQYAREEQQARATAGVSKGLSKVRCLSPREP
jgi:hypothetical protein